MELVKSVLNKIKTSKNQELSQSLVRTGLVLVVSIYLLGYYILYPDKEVVMPFIWAVFIYFVYCVVLVIHILLYEHFNPLRHYFTIVFDMSLLAVGMYSGGIAAAFFYGGYFWLILGNGLRFGKRSLHISVILAAASFTLVISFTPFWQENLVLGIGLMIWIFLLPPYIGKILRAKDAALEQALLADDAKSRFITNMSHELRTPLNGIIGYSQMITEDDIDLTEAKYAAGKIDKGAQHLLSLINELLDIASIESGKMKLSLEKVEISTLLDEVLLLVDAVIKKKEISIEIDHDSFSEIYVLADRLRLKQVIINLVSNAIKYNKVTGTVSLSYQAQDGMITLNIIDTGPGLSKDEQKKLFQPFERLSANSSSIEGAGIGLMITRSLINMMNGEIGVKSQKGQGSCFWIKLPLCQ